MSALRTRKMYLKHWLKADSSLISFTLTGHISHSTKRKKCSPSAQRSLMLYLQITEFIVAAPWSTSFILFRLRLSHLSVEILLIIEITHRIHLYHDHLRIKLSQIHWWLKYCKTFLWSVHKPSGRFLPLNQSRPSFFR